MSAAARNTAAVIGRHWRAIVLAVALLLATMLAGVALLGVSGGFLTAAALTFGVAGSFNFFSPSAGIRGLTLSRILSRYGEKVVGHSAMLRIARDLRVWFFQRALRLTPAQLGRLRTGDLMARLLGDIGEVDGLLVRALGPLFAQMALGVAAVAVALAIYLPAGLWLAALALTVGVGVPWRVAHGRQADEEARAAARNTLRAQVQEACEGASDLAALGATPAWLDAVGRASTALGERETARRQRLIGGNGLHALVSAIGLLGMLAWVCFGVAEAGLPAAQAAAVFFMTLGAIELWAGAGLAWQALQAGQVSMRRIDAIAAQAPTVVDPPQPQPVPARGELSLRGVRFAWSDAGREVLQGIDLAVAPGRRIAIRGDSGAGKSTLSALVLRSVDPLAGEVAWAGIDLRRFAQADWHARIAWLPQNAPLFAGSLRENLVFGAPQAEDASLWKMLEQVRMRDWAEANDGLQTWIGENGATLSGGQARRLALARALLRDAPLVLLDEPTEGLDHDTAQALLRDLPQCLGEERSLLMITHGELPPGTVHETWVLEDGRLRRDA
ncbi:thiol reductant ABC exporter subunit CydC [Pseudoxanthomonas kalamensis DSM 18571]|uniref:thiol reductant ABC exporter subunit CydC n=1 Tax=Pseudoxanthomonas kalamensis TaxID=289483 RepID=UPI001391ED2D|nr:thiol reductant ABC exporter subunit CydC [Pseudoxanthomonas kalamensis]KAF1710455.1 thiol reductant ABC exporter subunit CydC [Pseudoxanthomonas kalamensis DSM 18571]